MTEGEWVEQMAKALKRVLESESLAVRTRLKLAYDHEITSYVGQEPRRTNVAEFETDLALIELLDGESWKPRVVVEAKVGRVTTHDAITYSHKAVVHRNVHSYLRYGIMLGNRKHYPLPGRLFRHGTQFDFMASFASFEPTARESKAFVEVLKSEVEASRAIERILSESRKANRDRYTILHNKLVLR